jgi:hypothetical protein
METLGGGGAASFLLHPVARTMAYKTSKICLSLSITKNFYHL